MNKSQMEFCMDCAIIPVSKFALCRLIVENKSFASNQFHRQHLDKFHANYTGALVEQLHCC